MLFLALVATLSEVSSRRQSRKKNEIAPGVSPPVLAELEQEKRGAHLVFQLVPRSSRFPLLRVVMCEENGMATRTTVLEQLVPGTRLQIAEQFYQVQAVDVGRSTWAGISTWEDFLAEPAGRAFRFHFGTPVVLGTSPSAAGMRELDPGPFFPGPIPLFENLLEHWQILGGPALPTDQVALRDFLRDGGCIVTDYHLQGRPVVVSSAQHSPGFLGHIVYTCRKEAPAFQSTLTALARFAFFAGVGKALERGLGATRVTIQTQEGGKDAMVRCENRRRDV